MFHAKKKNGPSTGALIMIGVLMLCVLAVGWATFGTGKTSPLPAGAGGGGKAHVVAAANQDSHVVASVEGRTLVWMDVEVDGKAQERVVIELFDDIVPKWAANFAGLAAGTETSDGGYLTYAGHKCHRIIPGFIVQCGDITRGDGRGGRAIFPGGVFDDEPAGLKLKHDAKYIVQAANAGPNTNGSQFCFMLAPAPHLNGKHVVFGKVRSGTTTIDAMEAGGSQSGAPIADVRIVRTGIL